MVYVVNVEAVSTPAALAVLPLADKLPLPRSLPANGAEEDAPAPVEVKPTGEVQLPTLTSPLAVS